MIDTSKKYLKDADHPDIGNFVHWFIKQQRVKKKDVAKHLGVVHTAFSQYFRHHSLQFGIIWKISQAINYNMVMDLGQRMNIPFETKAEKELKEQLAEKNEVIKRMEIQLEVYEKMMSKR